MRIGFHAEPIQAAGRPQAHISTGLFRTIPRGLEGALNAGHLRRAYTRLCKTDFYARDRTAPRVSQASRSTSDRIHHLARVDDADDTAGLHEPGRAGRAQDRGNSLLTPGAPRNPPARSHERSTNTPVYWRTHDDHAHACAYASWRARTRSPARDSGTQPCRSSLMDAPSRLPCAHAVRRSRPAVMLRCCKHLANSRVHCGCRRPHLPVAS